MLRERRDVFVQRESGWDSHGTHRRCIRNPVRSKLRRNLSFTSAYMAIGTYPPKAKCPEPIISCALYFDDLPSEEDIIEHAVKPMLSYDRLAMIPAKDTAGTLRSPLFPVEPSHMVRTVTLHGKEEFYSKIQEIFNEPFGENPTRGDLPWWEFLLMKNTGDGPNAILFRIHHALGDGVSLASLFSRHVLKAMDSSDVSGSWSFLPPRMMSQKSSLMDERKVKLTQFQRFRQILVAVSEVVSLPSTPFDDVTAFSKASVRPDLVHSRKRQIIVFPTVPLRFIQAIKDAAKVTVNDVVLTTITQAVHDYCKRQNCAILKERGSKLQCRALLAAALPRDLEDVQDNDLIHNQFFLLSSEMSVGVNDVVERLYLVHENMKRIKRSPLAHVGMFIQNKVLKYVPVFLNQILVYKALVRHSMTVSNMPGPRQPVLFCGKEMTGLHMFFSTLSPQFGIISYAGKIYGNLTVDPEMVQHPETMSDCYREAMVQLAERFDVEVPEELK